MSEGTEDLDGYGIPLVGCPLLATEKRDYTWFFRFGPRLEILTEAQWRLVIRQEVVASSEDHGHPFGLPAPFDACQMVQVRTAGLTVERAAIDARTGDLRVEFGQETTMEFLQLSTGYQSWRLFAGDSQTYCDGGGRITHFPRVGR